MKADRVITIPADATQRLADRLQDENWHMDGDEASEIARDIVIDVTEAVDKLRATEAAEDLIFARDVQTGDVLLSVEYCERLTVIRVHDEIVQDSKVSIRRFETARGEDVGPVVVRGWWEALRVERRAAAGA